MSPARGELETISLLTGLLPPPPAGEVWIGDDAAVLPAPPGHLLLTVDTVVEGVHFDPTVVGPADAGWKALTTSVSDVAAMGGAALRAVVAASLPDPAALDAVYEGILEASGRCGCPVVGGDLTAGPVLTISVAATGTVAPGGPGPVLRSGARAGHRVWVTGALGASAAGLGILRRARDAGVEPSGSEALLAGAHRRPRAHLEEGRVARLAGAAAMIDVSDGLVLDLARVGRASGVAVELTGVPVAQGATLEESLGGGEDYVLAVCAPEDVDLDAAFAGAGLDEPVEIGRCVPGDAGEVLLEGRRLAPAGYEHWRG